MSRVDVARRACASTPFSAAHDGTTAAVTYRHKAMTSFRATATMPMRRARFPFPKCARDDCVNARVAAAAAIDPRFFGEDDVAITRLPNTHPSAYSKGQAAAYAHNLQDPLLFIYGMQDDVVPLKTIVTLMEQLMLLGKDFDVAIAPAATHGWSQREHYAVFMYRKLGNHFDRHLRHDNAESGR